jgi:hypothetical protein
LRRRPSFGSVGSGGDDLSDQRDTPKLLFELAGAAAGILAYVSLAGSAIVSARLHALGLSFDSTLAVLPREQVAAAGVRTLSLGLAAGLAVALALWIWGRVRVIDDESAVADRPGVAVLTGLSILPLLAYTLRDDPPFRMVALIVVATGLALTILVLVVRRPGGFGRLRWKLFALVAVYSAVLSFARAYSPPVDLAYADVQLRDGGRTSGYLLGQTSDSLVLAPDVLGRTIGRTVVLQRGDVVTLQISNVEHRARPIGPEPVSRFTVYAQDPREHAIAQTLLRIRLSGRWKYPPLLYRASVGQWARTFDEFTREGVAGRAPSQRTTLEDLSEHTPLFAGKLVRLRGRVLEATPWVQDLPQTIVFRQEGTERYLGTCELWNRERRAVGVGGRVVLTGLVVASGIFVSGSGTERPRVVMICETDA